EILFIQQSRCHLKLTPEADSRLLKLQYLLQAENLKLSKTSIINHLLENLSVDYLSKDLSDIFGGKIRNDIVQVFLNSEMNDDDLKILQQMEKNNKKIKYLTVRPNGRALNLI
ncbi:TPA: hypothetical protein R6321_005357, partial [Klebsiella pneumoniae]|nr:hypothetical protein [Klebsiella pneumoniae]